MNADKDRVVKTVGEIYAVFQGNTHVRRPASSPPCNPRGSSCSLADKRDIQRKPFLRSPLLAAP